MDVDQYPLSKPQDLFATLSGGKQFSKIDLLQAYLQFELDEESRKLVIVNTHQGLYKYNRLPFGVASDPALFQKVMDTILQGIPGVICYLDDILVTAPSKPDHLQRLETVLKRLEKHGVRANIDKCLFLQDQVEYLGHVVDDQGFHAAPSKVQALLKVPPPTNVKELRSLLGMINYYRKFIPNLATLLKPLTNLLQSNSKWVWSLECVS